MAVLTQWFSTKEQIWGTWDSSVEEFCKKENAKAKKIYARADAFVWNAGVEI